MVTIPTEIGSTARLPPRTIPFTLIQTYKDNQLHPKIYENTMKILRANPEFDYRLITDEFTEHLIAEHLGERELSAFRALKIGPAKGDFARYVAMYLYGGIYIDLDCGFEGRLSDSIDCARDFVFMIDHGNCLIQCFFATKPRHRLMKLVIDACCAQIERRVPRIGKATGPSIFAWTIYCAVLGGTPPEYSKLPIEDGVLQFHNEPYNAGLIVKLNAISRGRFRYKFGAYRDDMLYSSPDEVYNFIGPTRNLYYDA
jgi:hypothetical protein